MPIIDELEPQVIEVPITIMAPEGVGPQIDKHSARKRVKAAFRAAFKANRGGLTLKSWVKTQDDADVRVWLNGKKEAHLKSNKAKIVKTKKS